MNPLVNRVRSPRFAVPIALLLASSMNSLHAGLVVNPSFEANYNDVFPHYGPIDSWQGGSGVNEAGGPFHNGGTPIPDQTRVAFLQGASTLAQDITGLVAGQQYWIQFYYDARACCGGTIDLSTLVDDVSLDKIVNVRPVTGGAPYLFRNVAFTAAADFANLKFQTVNSGDATVVLDGVTLVQRGENNVVVQNPGFEASGDLFDTGLVPAEQFLAGWEITGSVGVANASQPAADNGIIPEQDHVGFLQGEGSAISQLVIGVVPNTEYDLTFAYNAATGSTPRLQVKVGDAVVSEENVTPVGAGNPFATKTVKFTPTEVTARITFTQVAAGDQIVALDNIQLVGETAPPLTPLEFSPVVGELNPGQTLAVTLTIPPEANANGPYEVQLRSANNNIATLNGANEEGVLVLSFAQGAARTANFAVLAVGRGSTRVEVLQSGGFPVNEDVSVNVVDSLVRNPSFESSAAPGGIGVGPILSWESTGTVGLNKAGQPFADNGQFPDRAQVALIQGAGSLQQTISNLKPGTNYWLQFRYNARNCCPEGSTTELTVTFDGQELGKFTATAVLDENPYNSPAINFVPTKSDGVLKFSAVPTGDATLLLDGINIVERSSTEVLILNPSFEASGSPTGVGYIQPGRVSGWDMTGGYGVNVDTVGPFTDNGVAAAQDLVLFMQGGGASASQLISSLVPNEKYTLIYKVNARSGGGPEATAYATTLDDLVLMEEELTPVGVGNPYYDRYIVFTAVAESGVLRFGHTTASGDHTLLLDDVRVVPGEVVPPIPQPTIEFGVTPEGMLRLAWPTRFEGFVLQKSGTINGAFVNDDTPVIIEGTDYVVLIEMAQSANYYRLTN